MYIYQITNLINNKIYIGQTNNIKKRWSNHKNSNDPNMVIARAIRKYGKENFKFEVLLKNLSPEEANLKEIELIKEKESLIPNGYNVASGGNRIDGCSHIGAKNSNAKLTEAEAQYILDNRNIPMYVLYEEFVDKLSYNQFKKVYNNEVYTNLSTTTPIYPYNFEFSNQFFTRGLEYDDVVHLRNCYVEGKYWRDVYEEYRDYYSNEWSFWNVYNGNNYKLVMPEVFTKENKHLHASVAHSGTNNGRAKLSSEEVLTIRKLYKEGSTTSELYKAYPQVSTTTVRNIINGKTWKNLL